MAERTLPTLRISVAERAEMVRLLARRKTAPALRALVFLVFAAFIVIADFAAAGAANDDVATGRQLAGQLCSGCHAIAGAGPSPVSAAPLFSRFARKWPIDNLAEALAEGIVTGHGPVLMPAFVLRPPEIDALLAYLKSVQE